MIACLIWWDEPPEWLASCVASVAAFCTHVVALDGAYSLMPGATAASPREQRQAIERTAAAHGIGCTIEVPAEPWDGQEPQKRTALFALAEEVAQPGDWLLSIDSDEEARLLCEPRELLAHLAATPLDIGTVHFEHEGQVMRRVHRAGLGWRAVTAHDYMTADGRVFAADSATFDEAEWLPVKIDHGRHDQRSAEDKARKFVAYTTATAYNFYAADPGRPIGRVPGCLRDVHPHGCGSHDCPADFRRRLPGDWRECRMGRELEARIAEDGADMLLAVLRRGPAWRERWVSPQ